MSSSEVALAVVGAVVVYHNGPRWLIPPVRPFTCAFCLAYWLGWAWWAMDPSWERGQVITIAPLLALLLTGFAPWAVYGPSDAEP